MTVTESTAPVPTVFDRALLGLRRDRAAARLGEHAFLLDEIGGRLIDRLDLIRRTFTTVLDLGCHDGRLAHRFLNRRPGGTGCSNGGAGHGGDGSAAPAPTVLGCDLSERQTRAAARALDAARSDTAAPPETLTGTVVADEESLPFAPASFDLVLSNLSLHWVNDLPGCLVQVRRILKPDGLFLAALAGGDTLFELRRALMEAELALSGGFAPRVSPFTDVRDAGALLQRAGFALPTVDTDILTVSYEDPIRLLADLRGMGETNATLARHRRPIGRTLFADMARRYRDMFGEADGRVPATVQIVYLCGWAPAESQPRPLRRGSAAVPLSDVLGPNKETGRDQHPESCGRTTGRPMSGL